jgi:hypothetical protein
MLRCDPLRSAALPGLRALFFELVNDVVHGVPCLDAGKVAAN